MTQITLKAARVNAGYSVQAAAEKLGISDRALNNYELGHTSPRVETLLKMLELYGCRFEDLNFFTA